MTKEIELRYYKTLVFDCDGVILNSNKIKTEAFYNVAKVYGEKPALIFKNYHLKNGGISRYAKFEYFLTHILNKPLVYSELDKLLEEYAIVVKKALLTCEVVKGIEQLRSQTENIKWLIVSGGDQSELREVFSKRGLSKLFNGGIFGSPDSKNTILEREIKKANIINPCLFLGDSIYDYHSANQTGIDFLFISQWTEVKEWKNFCSANNIEFSFDLQRFN